MIQVFDNLIPAELITSLHKKYTAGKFRYYWKSNKSADMCHWHIEICDPGNNNHTDISEAFYNSKNRFVDEITVWNTIKENITGNFNLHRVYVNGYTYGTEGAIHKDTTIPGEETVLMYLNQEWKPEWAGETVIFKDGDIDRAILPKPGRIIVFPSDQPHCARSLSKFCGELRMVLVFKGARVE